MSNGFTFVHVCTSIRDMQGQGAALEFEPQDCLLEASSSPRSSWGSEFSLSPPHKSAQEKNKSPDKKMHV